MIHIITDLSEKEKAILDKISQVSIKIQSERVWRYLKQELQIMIYYEKYVQKDKRYAG